MNKSTIVGRVAERLGLSKTMAEDTVDVVLEAIGEALSREETVRIAGFGTFETRSRAAWTGRNPRTGESVRIPASKRASFKPAKALRDMVNGVRDVTDGKRVRGRIAPRRQGTASDASPGSRVSGRDGLGEGPLTLEVSQWPGGVEPVWALLDPASRQALRIEPSAENPALRLACDLAEEELVQSVFVRNAMVVLEHTAAEALVWLTDNGNFRRDTVTALRAAMSWPDMEAVEHFREGKVLREQHVWELHLLHRLVDAAGLVDGRSVLLLLTALGCEMMETGRRGALQALLFRQAFWRTDLSGFIKGVPRGLPGMWPQGDSGVVLWSLSVAADEWQGTDTLAALCTVPDRWIPTAHWKPAAAMFAWRVLRPLWWFGLIERSRTETPLEPPRWRKSTLFDRFLSFDVQLTEDTRPGHWAELREHARINLHLLHRLVDAAGLVDGRSVLLLLTALGCEMMETGRRGALQALLFRQAFWRTDLSGFIKGVPRGLPGMWPQGDSGVVLWSLSVAADEWQGTDTLAALCTVPDRWIPTAHWKPAAAMFAWRVLRPLWWFGLIERSRTETPLEPPLQNSP